MKPFATLRPLVAGAFALAATLSGLAAPVIVNTEEGWDGINNPHEADGVSLSGSGTAGDPATYLIPEGLTIEPGGVILMSPSADSDLSIQFVFASGDLHIEPGGILNIARRSRNDRQNCVLDLGGGNITGSGFIQGRFGNDDTPRVLTIQNVTDVTLDEISTDVRNVNNSGRTLTITADGKVTIRRIDNSDQDRGGNAGSDVIISASQIDVGEIDTRAMRDGGAAPNGSIRLLALRPPGFDPAAGSENVFENTITLRGHLNAAGAGTGGGNVTVESVRALLFPGAQISKAGGGNLTFNVGALDLGAPLSDLVVDMSDLGSSVAHDVQWNGVVPPGGAPAFAADLLTAPTGSPDAPYSASLATQATGPDRDPLTFLKGKGPAWLEIGPDGTLSGTPTVADSGINSFTVAVTDGTRFDLATLRIPISGRPTFTANPILKPNGLQGQAYVGTLADVAADPDKDPISFAKLDGPGWLTVAANGALTGTPSAQDTFTNSWTVSVTDGNGTDTATLIIVVGGAPHFLSDVITKAGASAGLDFVLASASLAKDAVDPEGQVIQFAKVSGPAWLVISPDGALAGTPGVADAGDNSWTVSASDGTFSSQATLRIKVGLSAPVIVTTLEDWDGVQNPHAGEGVLLTGEGTPADPAVYWIPYGMVIEATGVVRLTSAVGTDRSIVFEFASGDLHIAEGGVINIGRLNRNGFQLFRMDLGAGSITGNGSVIGLQNRDDSPRQLSIVNAADVNLASIDLHVVNANNGGRNLEITATGSVIIPTIDISDQDPGGNRVGSVIVKAGSIEVDSIDARSMRTQDYSGTGSIRLSALGAPGYDPADAAANHFDNRLVVTGNLRTRSAIPPPDPTSQGLITLEAVALQLGAGFAVEVAEGTAVALLAGVVQGETTAGELFVDESAAGLGAEFTVQWSGEGRPPTVRIARVGGEVELTWDGSGFRLQENAEISNAGGWVDVTDGSINTARRPIGAGRKFYRLRK